MTDKILYEMGFTDDEVTHLVSYEQTLANMEETIQNEVMSVVIDEETEQPKNVFVPEETFIDFMNQNYNIVAGSLHPRPMWYNKEEGYWQELETKRGDVGNAIWANIIHPMLKQFRNDYMYLMLGGARDKWQHACKEYAKLLDSKNAKELVNTTNPNLIMFKNGVYDFKTNEIRDGKPTDYQTIKLDYPLVKTDEKTMAEEWLELLLEDNLQTLMELIGYLFYRDYKYATYVFFINGDQAKNGSNGKSYVQNFIKLLISGNASAVSLRDLDGKDKFATSGLYNKLANIEGDAPNMNLDNMNIIKTLTGNDIVNAQYKGQDSFTFKNYAKLIFATNHMPSFKDFSEATRERLMIIPFNKNTGDIREELAIHNQQKELRESDEELGKFAWRCIQAFRRLLIEFPTERNPFTKTQQQIDMVENYYYDNNTPLQFLTESGVFEKTGDPEDTAHTATVYKAYEEWCFEEGYKPHGRKMFASMVKAFDGVEVKNKRQPKSEGGKQYKAYVGIKDLTDQSDQETVTVKISKPNTKIDEKDVF